MSRYYSYLNSAKGIINAYRGEEPLHSFLKKKFASEKKIGSKDRKQISHLCYCFYRLGKMPAAELPEDRIVAALFLCSDRPNEMLQQFNPDWNEKAGLTLEDKLKMLGPSFLLTAVFPWKEELSGNIAYEGFCSSFFVQPDLFLRLRPGKEKKVRQQLEQAAIPFVIIADSCLSLPNSSRLDGVIALDEEAVIQDYNSQQTEQWIMPEAATAGSAISVWDCCAASGGKSIMAKDCLGEINLTVSDIRESILVNLRKRFEKAGIRRYKSLLMDLSVSSEKLKQHLFDLIIADVPCTGSGTWARTPEQLYYFEQNRIDSYASLQKKILRNVARHLKPGGHLLYITCSVFKKENEEAVEFMSHEFQLHPVQTGLLKGYDKKADTLFTALLKKES